MGMTIDEAINHIKYGIIENNYPLQRDLGIEACNLAIDTMRKYQQLQADYEARLKADLKAMLTEIQLEIDELEVPLLYLAEDYEGGVLDCKKIIQQKINVLKAESEVEDGKID